MGSAVKNDNGVSHNRHSPVHRTLFLLHYSQNWDNTTFLIISFGNLKPRRIITKGWCFLHHFLCSHRNFCYCYLYFLKFVELLATFCTLWEDHTWGKAIVERWLLRILFVNFPILQWSDSGRQTKVGAINREKEIFGRTSLIHTANWFWDVYVSWVYYNCVLNDYTITQI